MDDTLWMNHHFDPPHFHPKEPVRFDHFESFVEERCRINRNLGTHVPRWMPKRFLWSDRLKRIRRGRAKRAARCREDQASNIGAMPIPSVKALEDGIVLTVHREYPDIPSGRCAHHDLARHYQNL